MGLQKNNPWDCEIKKNYPWDYVRLQKNILGITSRLQKLLAISNILHSGYSRIARLQWDNIYVVKIYPPKRDHPLGDPLGVPFEYLFVLYSDFFSLLRK